MCLRLRLSSVEARDREENIVNTISAHHAPTLRTVRLRAALAEWWSYSKRFVNGHGKADQL